MLKKVKKEKLSFGDENRHSGNIKKEKKREVVKLSFLIKKVEFSFGKEKKR